MRIISAPFRFVLWLLWDFTGFRFLWEKVRPPIEIAPENRPPSTFFLWGLGALFAYLILFSITSQRFETRVRRIEERANTIMLQLAVSDSNIQKTVLSRVPDVQNMLCPYPPDIYHPASIFRSLFGISSRKHAPTVQAMKDVIESWKGRLNSVDLERADLRDAKLKAAKLSHANLKGVDFFGADLMNADLYGADLSGADLTNAVLRGADFREALVEGANLQGVDLRVPDNTEVWKVSLFGRDPAWVKHSGADLLCTAKTLYGAKMDPELEEQLMKACPHILKKPI